MPSIKLTKTFVDNTPGSAKGVRYMDTEQPGLCLRVRGGAKSYYYFRKNKEHGLVQVFLGKTSDLTVQEARNLAKTVHLNAAYGKAPTITGEPKDAQSTPEESESEVTGAVLARRFINEYARIKKRSWKDDRNKLEMDFIPVAGSMQISDIDSKTIREILKRPVSRGKTIAQNRLHACLSKMFNWAVEEELLDRNPMYGIKRKMKEKQKERVLSDAEIRAVWGMSKQAPVLQGAAQRVMLTCLTRRGETLRARWKDIDTTKGIWVIPGAETKNGKPHTIPLSELALVEFKALYEATGLYEHVFTDLVRRTPLRPDSVTQYVRRAQKTFTLRNKLGLENVDHFTVHDLRRTAATNVGALMGSREPVRRLLNHADSGATKVYDRHTYDAMKRQALDAWATYLTKTVSS